MKRIIDRIRTTCGETLVETLAATLIAMLGIVVLFTAAATSTSMNRNASERTAQLQEQQVQAASQTGAAAPGAVELAYDGTVARIDAEFFGGSDFASYRLVLDESPADATGSSGAFYNTRPVTDDERALFAAWPEGAEPLCWYRAFDQGREYFAARPAQQDGTLCLVYHAGHYYKCTSAAQGEDIVAQAEGFSLDQLSRAVQDDEPRWITAGDL